MESHPGTAGRVEVEILRRVIAGITVPERTRMQECPDGSIYLSSGLARRGVERGTVLHLLPGVLEGWQIANGEWQIPNGIAIGHQPSAIPAILFSLFAVLAKKRTFPAQSKKTRAN
jgi:hypothetical protein